MAVTRQHLQAVFGLANVVPQFGVILSDAIRAVVAGQPTAVPRFLVVRRDRTPLPQSDFSAVVGGLWRDLSAAERTIVRLRSLNPRPALGWPEVIVPSDPTRRPPSVIEAAIMDTIARRLESLGWHVHLLPGDRMCDALPLYFIPPPDDAHSALIREGQPVARDALVRQLGVWCQRDSIDCATAAVVFNFWGSAFPLTLDEFSRLTGERWTTTRIESVLAAGATLFASFGYTVAASAAPAVPEPHGAPIDIRVQSARTATATALDALCGDPSPQVITAVIANPGFGFRQARLIAAHHQTTTGLEMLPPNVLADDGVRTGLLRNALASPALLQRALRVCQVQQLLPLLSGHECGAHARLPLGQVYQQKFQGLDPDAQAGFILTTEGRCLPYLGEVRLGADVGRKLCVLPDANFTVLLIDNLTKFSGTPRSVLERLLRLPIVHRNPPRRAYLQTRLGR